MRTSPLLSLTLALSAVTIVVAPGCYDTDRTATPYTVDAGTDTGTQTKPLCGQAGALCAGNQYCAYKTSGSCGKNDETGNCNDRPQSCGPECPLVCGCDGKPYCNACEAQVAGSDTGPRTCVPSGGEVTAFSISGDPAKLVVFKTDNDRKICVRLMLINRLQAKFGLSVPNGWGVDDALISNDPSDCTITTVGLPPTPKGTAPQAVGGAGVVEFSNDTGQGGKFPCKLSKVNFRLKFNPQADYAWAPNVEEVIGNDVSVAGACQ